MLCTVGLVLDVALGKWAMGVLMAACIGLNVYWILELTALIRRLTR
jgi:hypothetical protein